MKTKPYSPFWESSILVMIMLVLVMCTSETIHPVTVIGLGAIGILAALLGLSIEREFRRILMDSQSVGDAPIRNELIGRSFKAVMKDGQQSDWTDTITDVKLVTHSLHLDGAHKNGETVSSTRLSVVGTRNPFGYDLSEILLLTSNSKP